VRTAKLDYRPFPSGQAVGRADLDPQGKDRARGTEIDMASSDRQELPGGTRFVARRGQARSPSVNGCAIQDRPPPGRRPGASVIADRLRLSASAPFTTEVAQFRRDALRGVWPGLARRLTAPSSAKDRDFSVLQGRITR
jgi:hypothetical protein